ncbi:TetR/AcrR family transcriptional regulator [Cytobacillus purgationiresistens]|uniref:AcrR family transcriptional regulator n=1 Tax=Cytobacillus purgationiresistens TaxID=863449 RepID=A0ABU0AS11_9BACI|nr:TetR/AcrR family transcriptional regulator [Cytobacillus purgationiresistens]MDQ0273664.1 AcrR family transcriptional regulator [Cytobacillus purgationiresistens]
MSEKPEKKPRKEITKRKVLNAAKELFIQKGVESVNMHQIALTAKVGQASLYRQYNKLSDICADIVREECQVLIDDTQYYLSNTNENLSSLDKLYQVLIKFVSYLEFRVDWICEVTRASTNYRPIQSPLYQWMRKICTELLLEAVEKGEITDVDVPFTVEAILGTLNNVDEQLLHQGYTIKRILEGIENIYFNGLRKSTN